mgnify:CR=1 FL=1
MATPFKEIRSIPSHSCTQSKSVRGFGNARASGRVLAPARIPLSMTPRAWRVLCSHALHPSLQHLKWRQTWRQTKKVFHTRLDLSATLAHNDRHVLSFIVRECSFVLLRSCCQCHMLRHTHNKHLPSTNHRVRTSTSGVPVRLTSTRNKLCLQTHRRCERGE